MWETDNMLNETKTTVLKNFKIHDKFIQADCQQNNQHTCANSQSQITLTNLAQNLKICRNMKIFPTYIFSRNEVSTVFTVAEDQTLQYLTE